MKKTALWVSVLVLTVMALSSCCTTKMTSVTKMKTPSTAEVMADLDIRTEKITHNYQVVLKKSLLIDEEELKENAVFDALKKVGADVLVAPQFQIFKKSCLEETTVDIVVTGYPAYYTNFRQKAVADKIEMRELKEGASYVIIKKNSDNKEIEVDKDIIVAPAKCNHGNGDVKLDINETTVDHVVLTNKGGKGKK